tara:strand:+ start:11106 stop:11549 length:444 start_codon:yes stop_codon:yes gene_type:complete
MSRCDSVSLHRALKEFQPSSSQLNVEDRPLLKLVLTKIEERVARYVDRDHEAKFEEIEIEHTGKWVTGAKRVVHGYLSRLSSTDDGNAKTVFYVMKHTPIPSETWMAWHLSQVCGDAQQGHRKRRRGKDSIEDKRKSSRHEDGASFF